MNCPPHHMIYADNRGEFSAGVCRKCGAVTVGRNWEPEPSINLKTGKRLQRQVITPRDPSYVEGKRGIL